MAISYTLLTSGNSASFSTGSITTPSITPGSNRLLLLSCGPAYATAPGANVLTVTGNGLTWVRAAEQSVGRRTLAVFYAMGASPTAGGVTITSSSGATKGDCCWAITEWQGIDTTGTDGSGAVGTVAVNFSATNVASLGLTITGTPATDDVSFATFGTEDDVASLASDALWDTIHSLSSGAIRGKVDWDTGQDLSPTWTWVNVRGAIAIGFIIKAVSAAPPTAGPHPYYSKLMS